MLPFLEESRDILLGLLLDAHIQEVVQIVLGMILQIHLVQVEVLRIIGICGCFLLLTGQAQFFIRKFGKVNIFIVLFRSKECLGIEAVFFLKIKINVEIILSHLRTPTFMV